MCRTIRLYAGAFLLLAVLVVPLSAAEFYLRAEQFTKTMPDGTGIVMWGFAQDSSFAAGDGTLMVPGPMLTVGPADPNLTIYLDNNLDTPISIVIPGQVTTMTPVRHSPLGTSAVFAGRVRSFTHETPAGNTTATSYTWTDLRPGTYIYHSGSHPACQVQMGLYGGVTKDAAVGQAYPGVLYDTDVVVYFSEIDPAFHQAVATGNYGPGTTMTSTIDYKPQYFLVNGEPYSPASASLAAGSPGQSVLIRFLNAGLKTHSPLLLASHVSVVAEDGYPYAHPRGHYSVLLPAMKTRDALVTLPGAGTYPIFDRALFLTNAADSGGGMLTYLEVAP